MGDRTCEVGGCDRRANCYDEVIGSAYCRDHIDVAIAEGIALGRLAPEPFSDR